MIPIDHIDAFAIEVFSVNPAAARPLGDRPADEQLHRFAAENSLPANSLCINRGEQYELRWLTPVTGLELCGQAMLAAVWVISEHLEACRSLSFTTKVELSS